MTSPDPDVSAYIAAQPPAAQAVLNRVRGIIRRTLPGAEEAISYKIPAYRLKGRYVVYFAGWKEHWSLYPVPEFLRAELGNRLQPYELRKGTVRFPWSAAVPTDLVKRIVKALAIAAELRGRGKAADGGSGERGRRRTRA